MTNVLYFVEESYGRRGKEFIACDRDKNSRESVIEQIRSGDIEPIKILEVIEPDGIELGTTRNVTIELLDEAGFCDDYRTPYTGEDLRQWHNDRRRALEMVS